MEEKLTANNVELATVTEKDGFKVLNEEEVKAAVEAIWGQSAIWPRISVVLSAPVFLVQVGKKNYDLQVGCNFTHYMYFPHFDSRDRKMIFTILSFF